MLLEGGSLEGNPHPTGPLGATVLEVVGLGFRVGRTARAGKTGQAFTLLLKVQVRVLESGGLGASAGSTARGKRAPFLLVSLQERKFLRMLAEAGVPEMARHDIPNELLQPLLPRYEEALSQLERAVKVRGWGALVTDVWCLGRPDNVCGKGARSPGRGARARTVLPERVLGAAAAWELGGPLRGRGR